MRARYKQRRGRCPASEEAALALGVLVVTAMVASLFAIGSPATAIDEDSKQDHAPKMTACLGDAVADRGFTDLGTLDAAARTINCLAYYGITAGRTADTFDPNANVTRSEMALFLYAAAGRMGVDLMGGDMMASYGDIDMLGQNRQDAITALARNGILTGRGMGFEPSADITRAEMAVALVALLDKTPGVALKRETMGANKGLYGWARIRARCPMTASRTPMRRARSR